MQEYNNVFGDVQVAGDVIIHGNVMGDVTVSGKCVVNGKVVGDVKTKTIDYDFGETFTNTVNKTKNYVKDAVAEASKTIKNVKQTLNVDGGLYMSGEGYQKTYYNGHKIESKDGVITINGRTFKGNTLKIKNDKVFIDGLEVDVELK